MSIVIRTNRGIRNAEVVKDNAKTWWVRLANGNHIKRHKVKHGVGRVD